MAGITTLDPWHIQNQNMGITGSDPNGNPTSPNEYMRQIYGDENWMRALGYTGSMPSDFVATGVNSNGETLGYNKSQQDFNQWLQDQGYTQKIRSLPGQNLGQTQIFDRAGNPIGPLMTNNLDPDDQFGTAALIAAAIATGGVAAAGGGIGAGAAGTTVGTAGAGGGLSSADLAALYGNAGYGAGMTGAETAAFDAGLSSLGAGGLEALPTADYSLEGAHYGVGGLNPATASPINAIPGVPSGLEGLPGADYSHEGLNYGPGGLNPTTASPINAVPGVPSGLPEFYSHEGGNYGPGGLDAATNAPVNVGTGAAGSALSNLGSSFKDWAAKNPIQAIQLAGMLGGKLFGGGQTISGGGIGSTGGAQADLTKNMPAAYSRQYVAPPAGYRPGISGEHVYFKNTGG